MVISYFLFSSLFRKISFHNLTETLDQLSLHGYKTMGNNSTEDKDKDDVNSTERLERGKGGSSYCS